MNALMPAVSLEVDVSSIQKAVELAIKSTSRKMELLLVDTAFYVAVKAQANTPYVELSDIDREMQVTTTPIISADYKGKSNITSNKKSAFNLTNAQKIVLARMNPNSNYNLATGGRWAIPYRKLSGINRYYVLEEIAEHMISARHSSTHFLQSGWKGVFKKIKALGLRGTSRLSLPNGGDVNNSLNTMSSNKVESLGDIQHGGQGTSAQWFRIENLIGTDGGVLAAEHNSASLTYGLPALQRGLDEQAQDMRDHYLPKVGDELAAEWNSIPNAAKLASASHVNSVRMAEKMDIADYNITGEMETALG